MLGNDLLGGGHEGGLRSGTPNVPGIVGFARAAKLAAELQVEESSRVAALRDSLWATLQSEVDGTRLNGCPTARLPNNLNVSFEGIDGDSTFPGEFATLCAGSLAQHGGMVHKVPNRYLRLGNVLHASHSSVGQIDVVVHGKLVTET